MGQVNFIPASLISKSYSLRNVRISNWYFHGSTNSRHGSKAIVTRHWGNLTTAITLRAARYTDGQTKPEAATRKSDRYGYQVQSARTIGELVHTQGHGDGSGERLGLMGGDSPRQTKRTAKGFASAGADASAAIPCSAAAASNRRRGLRPWCAALVVLSGAPRMPSP
jgi:hypothetical protein